MRVAGLDAIRFLMACIVMFSHAGPDFKKSLVVDGNPLSVVASQIVGHLFCGPAAVAIFFLLSGFVIHHPNVYAERLDVGPFLIRRWVRVALPLVAISAIAARLGIFRVLPVWSLYCELVYYTVYPLLFKKTRNWKRVFGGSLGASAILLVLYYIDNQINRVGHRTLLFNGVGWYLSQAVINFPIWVLGVVLANGIARHPDRWRVKRIVPLRITIFLGSVLMVALKAHLHCGYTYTVVPFSIGAQYWLGAEIIYFRSRRPHFIPEYAGRLSYSLYLCHMVCFHFAPVVPNHLGMSYWFKIGMTLVGAMVFYAIVEAPAHRLARWLAGRFQLPAA